VPRGCCGITPGGGRVATIVIRSDQTAFGLGCRLNGTPVGRTCDTGAGVKPMRALFGLGA
jgi:hypothetical protein